MKTIAIWGINLYQKYLSPYKGYRCAYGVYHQNGTCSSIIKSHIQEHGLIKAYPMIRGQFDACKVAYAALQARSEEEQNESCWKSAKDEAKEQAVEEGAGCACDSCSGVDCGESCSCDVGVPCDCSF